LDISLKSTKGLSKGLHALGPKRLKPISYSILKCSDILKQHIKFIKYVNVAPACIKPPTGHAGSVNKNNYEDLCLNPRKYKKMNREKGCSLLDLISDTICSTLASVVLCHG